MDRMYQFFKEQLKKALEPYVFLRQDQEAPESIKLWNKLLPDETTEKFLNRMKSKITASIDTLLLYLPYNEIQERCSEKKDDPNQLSDCIFSNILNIQPSEDWVDLERLKLYVIPLVSLWKLSLNAYFYTNPSIENVFLIQTATGKYQTPKPSNLFRVVPSEKLDLEKIDTYSIQVIFTSLFEPVTPEAYINIRKRYRLEITLEEANDAVRRLREGNKVGAFTVINYNELVWFLLIVYEHKKDWTLNVLQPFQEPSVWKPSKN